MALFCWVGVVYGWSAVSLIWIALIYLVFMIPLPNFLYFNLSSQLQLISSQIGVAVIRLFDISVFLEGNVIDLGNYQLQVVEACSGLRYLFPLMSFGFLIAYLYRGPFWHRALLFLATVPITVLMNSFRIGVIGVTVEYWGIEMAEGFLHDFEGWIIFISCLGILSLIALFLHNTLRDGVSFYDRVDLDLPQVDWSKHPSIVGSNLPVILCSIVLLIAAPAMNMVKGREHIEPSRTQFTQFPLFHNDWVGREEPLEQEVLDVLMLNDYIVANYHQPAATTARIPVNLYVAYYANQTKGKSIHSPKGCLPGGGWRLSQFGEYTVPGISSDLPDLRVNRAIMQKGEARQLVYYWFEQRGRNITNEYLAKWYIFWDSLTRQRTDGSLLRVITPVPDGMEIEEADAHIQAFLRDFRPVLRDYLPE
jgi:exosortase D (VPLPA-CTERM-specific)